MLLLAARKHLATISSIPANLAQGGPHNLAVPGTISANLAVISADVAPDLRQISFSLGPTSAGPAGPANLPGNAAPAAPASPAAPAIISEDVSSITAARDAIASTLERCPFSSRNGCSRGSSRSR